MRWAMKSLFLLIFVLCSTSTFAQNFYLLTSFSKNEVHQNVLDELEVLIQNAFEDLPLKIKTYHQVDPEKLYDILNSSDTVGVIWISHSAKNNPSQIGTVLEPTIIDAWGNNVKGFFTIVPPNLKFLGIVGCEARDIINQFKSEGIYNNHPELIIDSYSKKISLMKGFKNTLKKATLRLKTIDFGLLAKDYFPPETKTEQPNIKIKGIAPFSGWLQFGNTVVSYINANEIVNSNFDLNFIQWWAIHEKRNLKFIRNLKYKGDDLPNPMKELEIENWKLFKSNNGIPHGGHFQRLYLYKK